MNHGWAHLGLSFAILGLGAPSIGAQSSAQAPGSPMVRAGRLGFQVTPELRLWDSRFGLRSDGGQTIEEVEPLGFDFEASEFADKLPSLSLEEQALQDLTGDPAFTLRLGASRARLNALRIEIPVTVSLGLTDWLTVTGTVPFVRRRMEVDFGLTGDGATVGPSPGTSDPSVQTYAAQFATAIANVEAAADAFCGSVGESDPGCVDLRSIVTDADALLSGIVAGFGGSLFPLEGSSAALALEARVAAVRTRMLSGGDSTFIADTWVAPLPFAGSSGNVLDGLFLDPAVGISGAPLDGFQSLWEIGDVEAGVWVRLLDVGGDGDGPRLHVAGGAAVRLGTGLPDLAENFVDLGSGDGQNDVEVRGYGFLAPGGPLALRGHVRYGIQMEGTVRRRISAPDEPIGLAASEGEYQWDPGDYLDVWLAPEWQLTPELALGGRYRFHRRGSDAYASSNPPAGFDLTLLNAETETRVHYVGGGITAWPSRASSERGQWPIAASVSYERAISGSGGRTPKDSRLTVDLRVFLGLW